MLGGEFGNYIVRDKIGEGGMGEVFLAEHRHMGRKAAIKVLRAHGCTDAHDAQRFFNEARAASIIDHPGVVQVFDCDFRDGVAYIIMEYLDGESLAALLRRGHGLVAAPETIRLIGGQIANVLAATHAKGIVHRDLKPDNVFLEDKPARSPRFLVRILDFGIAKLVRPDVPGLTKSGTVLGTPAYMAPEQCAGDRVVDTRADIYSLGCILFEMAAGAPPFVGTGAGSLITAHMSEPPPLVSKVWPQAPAAFVSLVAQMLAKDPAQRPQTMGEIESRLAESLAATPRTPTRSWAPGDGPLLAPTVPLATEKEPRVATQIDPQAPGENKPASASGREDSLPPPTVLPPTGKSGATGQRPGSKPGVPGEGRLPSLVGKVSRKHLAVVAAAAVIGLTITVAEARRRPGPSPAPRASAAPRDVDFPIAPVTARPTAIPEATASPAPRLAPKEDQAALPSPTATPLPEVPLRATGAGTSGEWSGAAATDPRAPHRKTSTLGKGRSMTPRRSERSQPSREIRGFTDF